MTQAQLVKHIDSAARRADLINREPATAKQTWFLAGLSLKLAEKLNDETAVTMWLSANEILSKSDASRQIELALEILNK